MTGREPGVAHPPLALPEPGHQDDLLRFQQWLEAAIPMAGRFGMQRLYWQNAELLCDVRLEPNLNDKGTGFGGSLVAQSTLLGWCWATLWLRARGWRRDVVVAEATQRFLAPVTADYRLACRAAGAEEPVRFAACLDERGKGRIKLVQHIHVGDRLCFEAVGDYAVLPVGKRS
ncbi:YiiD C-terminal domain-containing protein [Halomonas sp. HP20-15]|uniref:YiiD C-terminal domain-containing protein n=1 Tax=Halomonas sp. HP20-15 TaxID=3085901 RepID=UPI002981163C|nr:YiiD C-terminal domain-containing protein [Halomonas sp. HP20-15]MDW5376942.1 YiiD C-terminal domain-containing protein [Halomonas sp. HP20-15]